MHERRKRSSLFDHVVNKERKNKFYDIDCRIHELPATLPGEQNPEAVHQLRLELPAPGIETESGLFVPK